MPFGTIRSLRNRSQVGDLRSRHTPCAVTGNAAVISQIGGRHTECACYPLGRQRLRSLSPVLLAVAIAAACGASAAAEPPAVNPFGPSASQQRDDAVPGRLELSDGSVRAGLIYLTCDARLKIYDEQLQRQREVPLQAVRQIDCRIKKEWMEKEWKFKETTSDEKLTTGRSYPVREYVHTLTLRTGRKITGPLAAIVYIEPAESADKADADSEKPEPERFLLNKRNKGAPGQELKSLVYVKRITFGKEALEEAVKKQKSKGDDARSKR
jgi:hypothetical protein